MIKHFILLVALCGATTMWAQDNLVENGQFTNGTTGWDILLTDKDQPIKAHIEHGASYKEYGLADNFVGTNFVELDAKSAIQQTLTTEPGKRYKLMFAYSHRPDAGQKQLIVIADGAVVHTKTVQSSQKTGTFTYKEVQFTASAPETKIGFYAVAILGGSEEKGILLTDIWCEAVSDALNPDEQKF